MELTKHFKSFFKSESFSGILLLSITFFTLITVNFIFNEQFLGF